ncbi:MAG: WD40/YVTN/BNR-like repeat-containing protein [Phycisphaerae bacterium]
MPPSRLIRSLILLAIITAPGEGQLANLGLFGGEVKDIAACSTDGATELFIAVAGHHVVYRCGPTCWEPVMKGPCTDIQIEADRTPGSVGLVWAVRDGSLLTHRRGVTWDQEGWVQNKSVNQATTLCGDASGMYIGGDGIVYRTTDGGRLLAPLVAFSNDQIRRIAVYNQTLFYVVSGKSLYRCFDDGNGFVAGHLQVVHDGASADEILSVAIDPKDPKNAVTANRFYVVCGGKTSGLYRTEDAGATWTRMPIEASASQVPAVAFVSFQGRRRIIAGTQYSDNFGQSWNNLPETTIATSLGYASAHPAGTVATADPTNPNLVYFATSLAIGQWDMTTARAGEIHNGAGIEGVSVVDVAQIADDPLTRGVVWAATSQGLAKTMAFPDVSAGEWLFPVRPQGQAGALTRVTLHPGDLEVAFAGDNAGTIYRTTCGGRTPEHWAAVLSTRSVPFSNRYTSPKCVAVTAIRVVGKDSTLVYAATAVDGDKYEGTVYRSLNNGGSWDDDFAAVGGQDLNMPVNDLAFLDGMVWAAVGHPQDPRGDAKGLYRRLSITGAAEWQKLPTGTNLDSQAVLAIKGVQVGDLRVLYATTEQGVFRGRPDKTAPAGWSWRSIAPNGARRYVALAADPSNPSRVLVADNDSIWASFDGGVTWGLAPSHPLTPDDRVLTLLYEDLLIGTNCGLFAASGEAFDPAGRIRTSAAPRRPTTQPSGITANPPQVSPQPQPDILPFRLPGVFGLGVADTIGIWLPLLAWLAIARHNRRR